MVNIIIFGGSGFIGTNIVKNLYSWGDRGEITVICQNIEKAKQKFQEITHSNEGGDEGSNKNGGGISVITGDILDEDFIKQQLQGKDVIINCIGKLFEKTPQDFQKFHTDFPSLLAIHTTDAQHLIHISALGVEHCDDVSHYAKTKLMGEEEVITHTQNYTIFRPSIVFGRGDNFLNQFARMAKISPILPLIGGGATKFQPVHVDDLVEAICKVITDNAQKMEESELPELPDDKGSSSKTRSADGKGDGGKNLHAYTDCHKQKIYHACGQRVISFKDILKFVMQNTKRKRLLLPIPFKIAKLQAKMMNFFKIYMLTPDQVSLLRYDNIDDGQHQNIDKIIPQQKDLAEYNIPT